jgi:GntR family transcriptional regulator
MFIWTDPASAFQHFAGLIQAADIAFCNLESPYSDLATSAINRPITLRIRPAPSSVTRKLGVDEGQPLLYFRRLVYADGEPIMLATVYVNVGEGITFTCEELDSDSIYPLLERKYNIVVCRADRTIEATIVLEDEAKLLRVKPNTPMLLIRFVIYGHQGQQVAFVKALYRGDRYKYYHTITR